MTEKDIYQVNDVGVRKLTKDFYFADGCEIDTIGTL